MFANFITCLQTLAPFIFATNPPETLTSSSPPTSTPSNQHSSDHFTRCNLIISSVARVSDLSLDSAGYSGSLSSASLNLIFLQILFLSDYFISGPIPTSISILTRLQKLILSRYISICWPESRSAPAPITRAQFRQQLSSSMDAEFMRHVQQSAQAMLLGSASSTSRGDLRSGGETGGEYMNRLIDIHPRLCQEQLRLTAEMLNNLVNLMIERQLLSDITNICVTEQVGMCLYILAKGASFRQVADQFKHSLSTVSKYFGKVLNALKELSFDIVRPHTPLEDVPEKIRRSSKYYPYFKSDAINFEVVKEQRVGMYLLLAHLTCYLPIGWEGSVRDQTVWKDSLMQAKYCFPHPPPGKYYLVDSGYPNTLGYLAPYMNVQVPHHLPSVGDTSRSARYHMPEFRNGIQPIGIHENFNYRHSSLRTTIERCFGVMKNTWRALTHMPNVSEEIQINIILAAFTLHNYIAMQKLGIPVLMHELVEGTSDSNMYEAARKNQMNQLRDSIAAEIMRSIPLCGRVHLLHDHILSYVYCPLRSCDSDFPFIGARNKVTSVGYLYPCPTNLTDL